MTDFVYVATNQAMPGMCKIGIADNIKERLHQLSRTSGVPLPFDLHCGARALDGNALRIEQTLHQLFAVDRVNPGREFFYTDPARVEIALSLWVPKEDIIHAHIDYETDEDRQAVIRAKKRAPFTFSLLQIPVGSTLTFRKDSTFTAEVINDREIMFNGEITTLSAAAKKITQVTYDPSGPDFWLYNNELLAVIRDQVEQQPY